MLKKQTFVFDLLLVFLIFFFSNISAFLNAIWLLPSIVMMQTAVWIILAAFAFIRLRLVGEDIWLSLMGFWFFLPFLVYSGLSIFWSVAWVVSLGRWLVLVGTLICGIYLGSLYTFKEMLRFLALFSVFLLGICGFYIIFNPDIGIMNYHSIQGAWKGVFWHKNHMGIFAAFSVFLCLTEAVLAWQARRKGGLLAWASLCFTSFIFVVKSDSAAGLMISMAMFGLSALGLLWLRFKEKLTNRHYLAIAGLFAVAVILTFINLDGVFGLFNRNTTLTGRVPMWNYVFSAYFSERPYWGYGFNAFWYIASHRIDIQRVAGYPDQIIIADNGFIDILINTGVFGFLLFMIFYFYLWREAILSTINSRSILGITPLMIMGFILLANISWSMIFENESYFMLIMIAIFVGFIKNNLDVTSKNMVV